MSIHFIIEGGISPYVLVAVGILNGKQKIGVTFNSDKLGSIDFSKISKLNKNFVRKV